MASDFFPSLQVISSKAIQASLAFGIAATALTHTASAQYAVQNTKTSAPHMMDADEVKAFATATNLKIENNDSYPIEWYLYARLTDPSKVIFKTPGVLGPKWSRESLNLDDSIAPNAMIVDIPAHNFQSELLTATNKILSGTRTETFTLVIIDSHGYPDALSSKTPQKDPDPDQTSVIQIDDFLSTLIPLQQARGEPYTKELLILGCNAFADLGPSLVAKFRNAAKTLHMNIVGPLTLRWSTSHEDALYVRFGHDGSVSLDPLSASPTALATDLQDHLSGLRAGTIEPDIVPVKNGSDEWFKCHNGKTQEQGAACQNNFREHNFLSAEKAFAKNPLLPKLRLSSLTPEQWDAIYVTFLWEPNLKTFTAESAGRLQKVDLEAVQNAIRISYVNASAEHDKAAVVAHEKLMRSLSPEGCAFAARLVDNYLRQVGPRIAARFHSHHGPVIAHKPWATSRPVNSLAGAYALQ